MRLRAPPPPHHLQTPPLTVKHSFGRQCYEPDEHADSLGPYPGGLMRSLAFVVLVTPILACSPGGFVNDIPDAPGVDPGFPPPARGFQIQTPTVDINPGAEVTYCYYFH